MNPALRILMLLLPLWVGSALANKADQDKPLVINADKVDVDDVKQSYQLSGDVLLIKGSMIAKGDKGSILVDPQGYQNIDLKGKLESPATMRQRREGLADEFMQGIGRDVFYDDKKEQVILTGNATIKRLLNMQMLDQLQGWQIEYEDIKESYKVRPQKVDTKAQPQSRAILAPVRRSYLINMISPKPSTLLAEGLQKRYGSRTVVRDVSIEVKSGEVVGLLGPNGAGKTTSFYMIVGLVPLDGGSILLDGEKISGLPIHRRARLGLSYLPQEASVFRKLNVAENIQAVLELQEIDGRPLNKKQIQERLDELLGELQITHLRNNPALSLSGGERRRVEIARALASHPKFILLDEPFAGVDPIAVGEIQRIVRFLRDRQIGVLITDHNVRETLGICDHAYIISEGSVLAEGKADEIIQNDAVRRVYLGENFRM